MQKNSLCFSVGGIKVFAHIGALKALEEKNLKFDMVAGSIVAFQMKIPVYEKGYQTTKKYIDDKMK